MTAQKTPPQLQALSSAAPATDLMVIWPENGPLKRVVAEDYLSVGGSFVTFDTLAALQAADPAAYIARSVFVSGRTSAGDGFQGVFQWLSGNQSANVTADTLRAVFVAPTSAPTGASGCWRRVFEGALNLLWFGAKCDSTLTTTVTDNQTAIEAALDLAAYLVEGHIYAPGVSGFGYAHSNTILFDTAGIVIIGDGGGGNRANVSVASTTTYVGRGALAAGTNFIATFSAVGGTTLGSNPIATSSGLPTVTITQTAHGKATGDLVTISGATAVGGLTLSGNYKITVLTANTYTVTASSNASSTATGGGSAVVVQFGKPQAWAQVDGCGFMDCGLARTDTAYGSPVSTPPLWSPLDCALLAYPKDDTGFRTARRWVLRNCRIFNQPGHGFINADNAIDGDTFGVEINYVRGAGAVWTGGSYLGRTNTRTNGGQTEVHSWVISDIGGPAIMTTGYEVDNTDSTYRLQFFNLEPFYVCITPTVMPTAQQNFGIVLGGSNHAYFYGAISGRNPSDVASCKAFYLRGGEIRLFSPRIIDPINSPVEIFAPWSGGGANSTDIVIDTPYAVSTTNGAAYYNPLVVVATTTRGVRVSMNDETGSVSTLMTKTAGTRYWEEFNGVITTDMDVTVDDLTFDTATGASGSVTGTWSCQTLTATSSGTITRATIGMIKSDQSRALNDDQAGYFTFSGLTIATVTIAPNLSSGKAAVVSFRCGDANAYGIVAGGSSGVVAQTGTLNGTTGVDGNLTLAADTATNRLYIENRTGSAITYSFTFDCNGNDRTISSWTVV